MISFGAKFRESVPVVQWTDAAEGSSSSIEVSSIRFHGHSNSSSSLLLRGYASSLFFPRSTRSWYRFFIFIFLVPNFSVFFSFLFCDFVEFNMHILFYTYTDIQIRNLQFCLSYHLFQNSPAKVGWWEVLFNVSVKLCGCVYILLMFLFLCVHKLGVRIKLL